MKEIELTKKQIDAIFEEAEHQGNYFVALYRHVYPEVWDDIDKVDGFPTCTKVTAEYIMQKAVNFDKEHHPEVFNGGLWMNKGFSIDPLMEGDWIVVQAPFILKIDRDNGKH